jgi:hypothetical protein
VTAAELIEQLRTVPPDSEVFVTMGTVLGGHHSAVVEVQSYTEDDGQHTVWIGPPP